MCCARRRLVHLLVLLAWVRACGQAPAQAEATREQAERLEGIEQIAREAIARGELPGCVVAIGTSQGVLYTRALGERTHGEPMTLDTLFDLASLTKPLATAASIMRLVERNLVALDRPAARYLPALDRPDKRAITVRQLLLHTSGLPQVGPLSDVARGRAHALARIAAMRLTSRPGSRFDYSDLGYVLLGELVARVAGEPLDRFARAQLFAPLRMHDTRFGVAAEDVARTAPTEARGGAPIRGVVDDPRAYRLGGVAGHAGVFSTAADVARFAQMLLRGGELDGVRVLAPDTVRTMLARRAAGSVERTLGFDVQSPYAKGRGTLLSREALGHGGYTGTSLWIDPTADLYVVVLSNRVHARGGGTLHPLASSIADLAMRGLRPAAADVRLGIDVLREESYARLRGRSIALLTHEAARDRHDVTTLDRLQRADGVTLRSILTPEHGLSATHEGKIGDRRHAGIPVHSLFGETRRPSAEMLHGADTIVIDLVDVGTRFYTYMASVLATLEVAAALGRPVLLLDRPNPIDGVHVEGPVSEPAFASFVNYHPLPLRHGMTAGELARFLCRARGLATRLHVVRVEGWDRSHWHGALGLRWHPPSPNLGSAAQAMLYPATGLLEGTNLSVGRGSARAFRVLGAPFVDAASLVRRLARDPLHGVDIKPTRFRPTVGPYARRVLPGAALTLRDPARFSAARTGLALIRAMSAQPGWQRARLSRLLAHEATLAQLDRGVALDAIIASWSSELTRFLRERSHVLLYGERL